MKRFHPVEDYERNVARQVEMTPETLAQLRGAGVGPERELALEYFFYTDQELKASALRRELAGLGYSNRSEDAGAGGAILVSGWTTRMAMEEAVVVAWVRQMCALGFAHDAEFDGWGTSP